MTNIENIKNMTDEELCDYIYSVFLTGKYYGQLGKSVEDAPDYMKWLHSEMRPATDDEKSMIDAYVESISTETSINLKEWLEK